MKKEKKSTTNKPQTDTAPLDDLYKDSSASIRKPIIKSASGLRAYYFVVCLLFGILGGILGELFVNNYFSSQGLKLTSLWSYENQNIDTANQQVIVLKSPQERKPENNLQTIVEAAAASVVGIFPAKQEEDGGTVWDDLYLPNEQLGNGLILSSDGWIVTSQSALAENEEIAIVLADKTIFPVEQTIIDEASGAVFLKINAQGLKVVKFGSQKLWLAGDEVLVLANSASNGGVKTILTNLKRINYQPISTGEDLLQNTEKYQKKILLGKLLDEEFFGSPVINLQGEIVGLADNDDVVIPHEYFSQVLPGLLGEGQLNRPFLGVNYLDLAHMVGLDENISEKREQGAVLYGLTGEISAVVDGSPAARAGLKAGDIILKVNNESVDRTHSLTELIQEYSPGDAVNLTIAYQGSEREVSVVLGDQDIEPEEE